MTFVNRKFQEFNFNVINKYYLSKIDAETKKQIYVNQKFHEADTNLFFSEITKVLDKNTEHLSSNLINDNFGEKLTFIMMNDFNKIIFKQVPAKLNSIRINKQINIDTKDLHPY